MTQILTSLQTLIPNTNFADLPLFDRTGWKRVRFSDVVENCAETCNPEEADLERFIAMEHLEPGSLHIRSWGNVADGTTFTRRCRTGQVLFGKRRAYQRKVAVAEFDAVVSGDIYVFAPKDSERLLPELLPFLCMSERFFQHAVGTSAGSLSPRTNWSSLATFEFDLPPLDQQRRIADILWAIDEVLVRYKISLLTAETNLSVSLASHFNGINNEKNTSLGEISDIRLSGVDKKSIPNENAVKLCNYVDVYRNRYITEEIQFMAATAKILERTRFELRAGDILITKDSEDPSDIAVPALVSSDLNNVLCGYHLAMIRPDTSLVDPKYLLFLFRSSIAKSYFASRAKGITRFAISLGDIRDFQFRLPPKDVQRRKSNEFYEAETLINYLSKHGAVVKTIMMLVINNYFGE
jgi:type I restriction enzyme S subunit